jgi:hypothetical protein
MFSNFSDCFVPGNDEKKDNRNDVLTEKITTDSSLRSESHNNHYCPSKKKQHHAHHCESL